MPLQNTANVKVKNQVVSLHAVKAYGGLDLWLHLLFKYVLYGGKWSASGPEPFSTGKLSLRMTQSQSKHFKEENNSVNLPEI
jgi:hypothetical protein